MDIDRLKELIKVEFTDFAEKNKLAARSVTAEDRLELRAEVTGASVMMHRVFAVLDDWVFTS